MPPAFDVLPCILKSSRQSPDGAEPSKSIGDEKARQLQRDPKSDQDDSSAEKREEQRHAARLRIVADHEARHRVNFLLASTAPRSEVCSMHPNSDQCSSGSCVGNPSRLHSRSFGICPCVSTLCSRLAAD